MATIDLPDPPFADETEGTIRDRMLAVIDDAFNKDEGDVIFDMLTPAAIEIDTLYDSIENSLDQCFVPTATDTYLDALAATFTSLTRATDESDTDFRNRVMARLASPPGAGTIADYATWALESSEDVAHVYVEPLWAGDGTVRIFAAQPSREPIDAGMTAALETYLAGVTPMGVIATAAAATTVDVDIVASVELQSAFSFTTALQSEASTLITDYVAGLTVGDEVVYNEVIAALMATEGIYDVASLTLNATTDDIAVGESGIAIIGLITITEA